MYARLIWLSVHKSPMVTRSWNVLRTFPKKNYPTRLSHNSIQRLFFVYIAIWICNKTFWRPCVHLIIIPIQGVLMFWFLWLAHFSKYALYAQNTVMKLNSLAVIFPCSPVVLLDLCCIYKQEKRRDTMNCRWLIDCVSEASNLSRRKNRVTFDGRFSIGKLQLF